MSQENNRFLIRFAGIYLVFAVFIIIFLKYFHRFKFNQSKLDQMIIQRSAWRDVTDNPCKYQINGDPVYNSAGYYKINIYCKDGSKSLNTISLVSLKDDLTYKNIINELARINGFNPNIIIQDPNNWNCHYNQQDVKFENQITPNTEINCYQKK